MTGRPYARPLEAVDTVESQERDGRLVVTARKTVSRADPYLSGHFPGLTLYPAVFLLEGVRQSVGAELARLGRPAGSAEEGWLEIRSVRSLRVLRPMLDGDELELTSTVDVSPADGTVSVRSRCERVGGHPVAELSMELVPGGDR